MTLTGVVLLVVCLNISGMMQVRGAMRERAFDPAGHRRQPRPTHAALLRGVILAGVGGRSRPW